MRNSQDFFLISKSCDRGRLLRELNFYTCCENCSVAAHVISSAGSQFAMRSVGRKFQ
jgi:hypothetical protein